MLPGEGVLLRIYISEQDKVGGIPLSEAIVREAMRLKLSGATVLSGVIGFGSQSHLHTAKLLDISDNLPLVVEVIDNDENIKKLIPFLEAHVASGMVTSEPVHVLLCKPEHK